MDVCRVRGCERMDVCRVWGCGRMDVCRVWGCGGWITLHRPAQDQERSCLRQPIPLFSCKRQSGTMLIIYDLLPGVLLSCKRQSNTALYCAAHALHAGEERERARARVVCERERERARARAEGVGGCSAHHTQQSPCSAFETFPKETTIPCPLAVVAATEPCPQTLEQRNLAIV